MDSSLLATSLRIPPLREQLIHRARPLAGLDQALAHHRLVLVSAPAGYGKTTLLAQWAHARPDPVVWVTLSAAENDPERLLRALLAAWADVQPAVLSMPVGLLLGATDPAIDTVLPAFINAADAAQGTLTFILDDLHLLDEPAAYRALTFLLDHLPPRHRVVLAGRADPPLPLARYRARRELHELRTEALQFALDETRALLRDCLRLELDEAELQSLHDQLEGWVAGVQMAALTRRLPHDSTPLPILGGQQRFIADFLHDEVLAHLPAEVRRFLLQTSLLDHLCADLCDAVTGGTGSQQMLELLERENLFLTPLDDRRGWFRYHPLFAGVLRDELQRSSPDDLAHLHRRAARWFLDAALPEQAFQHAVAGQDLDLVTRIGDDYAVIKMESGELNVVARWVSMIPDAWYAVCPPVNLLRVAYLIYTGAFDESIRLLDEVEARVQRSPDAGVPTMFGKVATIRCAIACFLNDLPRAEAAAAQALAALPADERFFRASIYHALGETYARNAAWDQARDALLRALETVHPPSWRIRAVHIYGALADLELRQGHLTLAGEYWRKALAVIQERQMWGRLPIPVTGWVAIRLGELSYERNDLDDARQHLQHGLELAQLGGDVRSLLAGHLLGARVSLTEGDSDGAASELAQARALLDQAQFPEWESRLHRCQLELALVQGHPPDLARWAGGLSLAGRTGATDEPLLDHLTLARALTMTDRPPERQRARHILRDVIASAAAHSRKGIEIEALALDALAGWAVGDRAGALISLDRALNLAEPEGFVRLFADLGPPLARLLQEARHRQTLSAYGQTLLAACAAPEATGSALVEPLSAREDEVLRLLAAGLTNREIAETLFISAETVKKHTSSIYAKLAASRRAQAVARARELGLLDHAP